MFHICTSAVHVDLVTHFVTYVVDGVAPSVNLRGESPSSLAPPTKKVRPESAYLAAKNAQEQLVADSRELPIPVRRLRKLVGLYPTQL